MKIGQKPKWKVDCNHYLKIAMSVCKATGLSLNEALSLTLVEAWISMGAEISG